MTMSTTEGKTTALSEIDEQLETTLNEG